MKKAAKIILWVFVVLVIVSVVLYILVLKGVVHFNIFSDARTLYGGSVHIEPVSLAEIKASLDKQACNLNDYKEGAKNPCIYRETTLASYEKQNGITILPGGMGWGPNSFSITEDTIQDTADIPGSPNHDKFKEVVRGHARMFGTLVQIKEDSWDIKTTYPWDAIY